MSRAWIRGWAKRIHLFPHILSQSRRRRFLTNRGARVGDLTFIAPLAKFEGRLSELHIGSGCFVGDSFVAVHNSVRVGNHVCINDGVSILSASHDVMSTDWKSISKPIEIDDYAWIATGATILPGVKIGRGAVVGAAAVVSKSVGAGEIVVGNPARPSGSKRPNEMNYSPVEHVSLFRAWLSS